MSKKVFKKELTAEQRQKLLALAAHEGGKLTAMAKQSDVDVREVLMGALGMVYLWRGNRLGVDDTGKSGYSNSTLRVTTDALFAEYELEKEKEKCISVSGKARTEEATDCD